MSLKVGHIAYANCAPFFHHLKAAGFSGEIVHGVPAELNRLLAQGRIDISPSSSFEYARQWRDYLLLPGHSISSLGPVQSVLLFSPHDLAALDGETIILTGESATSVNLLKVILNEFVGCRQVNCEPCDGDVEAVVASGGSALLIGDRALRASFAPPEGTRIYDLGALWYHQTGLPFVFALWILRRDAARDKGGDIGLFAEQLEHSRNLAFADLDGLAAAASERSWFSEEGLVRYWRQMSYDLDPLHLQGLELFFHLCYRHGLLDEEPELCFWQP